MRLTVPLCKESMRWLFKRVRLNRGMIRVGQGSIPSYIQEAGPDIINPNEAFKPPPRFPKWEPPVTDDPRFMPEQDPSTHPDYHEVPVYKVQEQSHLVEGHNQALLLTKTHLIEGLPERLSSSLGAVSLPRQDELVQRYIMQANIWNPTKDKVQRWRLPETPRGWKFKAEFGIKKRKTNAILLQNMLRLCESLRATGGTLSSTRRISSNHPVTSFFDYQNDKRVLITSVHDFMVSTNEPLRQFATDAEVQETVNYSLPDLYPVAPTIDIRTEHIYKEINETGWLPGARSMYPHTILHNHRDYWKISRQNAKAILFCFNNCLAVAKAKYGPEVKDLPEPITVQWIGCNEDSLHFLCYQLNTLDFSSDSGIKNIVWIDSENKLYNKILPKRSMLRNTKYEDYDPTVFQKFLALYLNDCNIDLIKENLDKMIEHKV